MLESEIQLYFININQQSIDILTKSLDRIKFELHC